MSDRIGPCNNCGTPIDWDTRLLCDKCASDVDGYLDAFNRASDRLFAALDKAFPEIGDDIRKAGK